MKALATISICLGLSILPLTASASGGVWCQADDDNVKFDFSAGQSRDGSGGWFGLQGEVTSKVEKLPADLAKFSIKDESLTERWADRDSIRLKIEKIGTEQQNFASVRLTVIGVALEELTYKGPYILNITMPDGSTVTKDGAATCSAE